MNKTIDEKLEEIIPDYGGCGCMSCDSIEKSEIIKELKIFLKAEMSEIGEQIIGKDQRPAMETVKLRPEASMAEYGAFINFIRNNLKKSQRKALKEKYE